MPTRINLKELFGSDSQGVTVDKLNFNFNKNKDPRRILKEIKNELKAIREILS